MEVYKNTEMGSIPLNWEVKPLNKSGDVIYGIQAAVANNTIPNGHIILTNINITLEGRITLEKIRYYKLKSNKDFNTILQKGDLLFNWRSGSKEHVGKTAYFDLDGEYTHSSFILRIRPNRSISGKYLFFYLNYLRGSGYFVKVQTYSINAKFNKSAIEELPVILPPLPEQRKIAYILSTIQKAIEYQEKLIRHTTQLKKALMQKLFTEGTKGEKQKQTEIGLVPESWEVTTIGEMYNFTSKPRGLNVELPVPFIPMDIVPLNDIYIEKYELRENLGSGTYVENGDLLLAKITPSFENGKQGIVSIDKPYSYATTEVIPIKDKAKISDKYYLFYYLLKDDVRKPLTDKMEGSTGRQRLSKTILEETLIPKPPFGEQEEIAKIFLSFNEKLSFLQKKKQTLSDLFKTLLHELMTGERRVHEKEFEALIKAYKIKEQPLSLAADK